MNTLLYVLTAVSALSSQLYSSPSCNGPGCQSNSSAGATWSPSSNRGTDSRRYSQYSDPRQAAACQCRTCDPRFPCSPENCGRQNCQDCLNGCQNCAPGSYSSQANDGWEPRASDLQGRGSAPQVSVQRICPVTGEELGSMGRPIPVSVSGLFRSAVRPALLQSNGILKNICRELLKKSEPCDPMHLKDRRTLGNQICKRVASDCAR